MDKVEHKMVSVNGLNMHVAELGEGPDLVLFVHGFPELWYSWRHQITFLAAHGYRAVAPDLRGYGETTGAPINDPTKFSIFHLVGDLVGLLDAIAPEVEKVFVVGHDWGAIIAWHMALFRPDKVKALVALSVPYFPRDPLVKPLDLWRNFYGDDHYICRFQEPGDIEAELAPLDVKSVMRKFFTKHTSDPLYFPKGKGFVDTPDTLGPLPSWLSDEDLEYYATRFEKNGITGAVNYYRSFDLNWELTGPWTRAQIKVPAKFIIGDLDLVYHMPGVEELIHGGLHKIVPFLEEIVVVQGVAHFIQQERPQEISDHILDFIQKF